ncbi:hypothetical protein PTI98_009925 [Pleurotus ostreatus]|nr:hypothetical protein PTI98_009925 [Pleurotus ostreatus]
MLQFDHLLNSNQQATPFHMSTVRKEFTKGIPQLLPNILDETTVVLGQALKLLPGSEYTELPVMHDIPYIVARITNRAIVGTDLCRNEGFIKAVVHFAETVFVHGRILLWTPVILRPLAYFILSSVWGGSKQPLAFLKPYFAKRLEERTLSDDHPFNLAELLINDVPPHLASDIDDLSMRILNINFASIHTSSLFFAHTLFEAAQMSPEDIDSIRIEVEQALEQEGGWTKSVLNKFTKIDSILREIARFHGLTLFGMSRRTIADGLLSDGVVIPAGHEVAFDVRRIHFNPEVYRDPYRFDPFRFSKIRAETDCGAKYGFTTVDNHFLPFGLGRHACPGRFFASMQLKVIIAYFLLNYDIKFPAGQTTRPKNVVFAGAIFPPLNAHLLVKPRRRNTA